MYPGIRHWVDHRVVPGLRTPERAAYVGYLNEKPVVSAVLKRGERSKFCHLRIPTDLQDSHLGELFFSLMAVEVRHVAREVHFTLPESVWARKGGFFRSFGFGHACKADRQYRASDTELSCSASFATVWRSALEKLPKLMHAFSVGGYRLDNTLVMSIRPRHLREILTGRKRVEVRRRFSRKWVGKRVSLYASAPVRALVGEATIANVVAGKPEEIWAAHKRDIGCTREEFDQYTASAAQVSALVLEDVAAYKEEVYLSQISTLIRDDIRPPQSHCSVRANGAWAHALSIAALLHGSLSYSTAVKLPS